MLKGKALGERVRVKERVTTKLASWSAGSENGVHIGKGHTGYHPRSHILIFPSPTTTLHERGRDKKPQRKCLDSD